MKKTKQRKDDLHVTYQACARMRTSYSRWLLGLLFVGSMAGVGWAFNHSTNQEQVQAIMRTEQRVIETKMEGIEKDIDEIKEIAKTILEKM